MEGGSIKVKRANVLDLGRVGFDGVRQTCNGTDRPEVRLNLARLEVWFWDPAL